MEVVESKFRSFCVFRVVEHNKMQTERKHLSKQDLISTCIPEFDRIKHPLSRSKYALRDCLLGGLAIFGLKYSSLLQLDEDMHDPILSHNLKKLYQIKDVPSDTHFREILDDIDYERLNYVYDGLIRQLQRGKCLFDYQHLNGHYLISIDGTGYFSSEKVHCKNCGVKNHSNGKVSYYHQALSAVLVHPDLKQVFPLAVEPIMRQDGKVKNDCERNATIRLIKRLRSSHPNFKIIVVMDALYTNGPLIKLLQELDLRFIITAKNVDYMYDQHLYNGNAKCYKRMADNVEYTYVFNNDLPLNEAHKNIKVNLLEYNENGKRNKYKSSWITDISIRQDNMHDIMKGARARWRIENETFNTLKNHGYHFGHNFGHGNNNLSVVLCHLMFIAFLIDQIQERFGYYYNKLAEFKYSRKYIWERLRTAVLHTTFDTWDELYLYVIDRFSSMSKKIRFNTT